MKYFLPDYWYDVIKWAVLIAMPALATLINALGTVWGFDPGLTNSVCCSIAATATFFGALVGVSEATKKPVEDEEGEGEEAGNEEDAEDGGDL